MIRFQQFIAESGPTGFVGRTPYYEVRTKTSLQRIYHMYAGHLKGLLFDDKLVVWDGMDGPIHGTFMGAYAQEHNLSINRDVPDLKIVIPVYIDKDYTEKYGLSKDAWVIAPGYEVWGPKAASKLRKHPLLPKIIPHFNPISSVVDGD